MKQNEPNEPPLVSLLIPIYGVENYIEECLHSVLRQTYTPLEIILVDDCSPDRSVERAKRLIAQENKHNHQIHLLRHEKNLGIAGARITALKKAQGELLFFLDSDDYFLSPYAIEKSVECMLREQADMLIFNYTELFKKSRRRSTLPRIYDSKELVHALLEGATPAYFWNKVFRRNLFLEKANFFQLGNNMWEDMQNVVPYSLSVQRIAYIEESFVAYRRTNERSVTLDPSHKNVTSMKKVIGFLENLFIERLGEEQAQTFAASFAVAYHTIDIGVLCNASYQDFSTLIRNNPELHAHIRRMPRMSGYFLRWALLCHQLHLTPLSFLVVRSKEFLQKRR
ncbi:hypothetical protein HQ36_07840 [Porphyromonas gingivicanis]|uniref:Glycosyltransferase 2-like domain-containing protein n=1 Tax=Porphyromonas gingivicanis TaxID=266762 RepID=A0A0A2G1T7_9PORP|nr:glycosyltransferase family 2 protein [Porphyromonas gingivicanis]KGN97253.1 hypothetical protein HQ36_07840 [Porphyromonas gingivicanis]